ncbi:arginase [Vibrio maritimus]|uniref:Arginase n=1 Tax=Vibrio maritimus TaxID=990268 RepID=A0A090RT65_9VIBR|nr:arginase [Vibrio maritimus]
MSKVILTGYIEVPNDEISVVTEALNEHILLTRKESGCIVFKVTPHEDISGRFDVYEEFVDTAAFELHQARVAKSDWGKVTVNVKRFYEVVYT